MHIDGLFKCTVREIFFYVLEGVQLVGMEGERIVFVIGQVYSIQTIDLLIWCKPRDEFIMMVSIPIGKVG